MAGRTDSEGYSRSPLASSIFRTGSLIRDREKDSSILRIWRKGDPDDLENGKGAGKGVKSEIVKATKMPSAALIKSVSCQETDNPKKQMKVNHIFRLILLAMTIFQSAFTATSMYFNVSDRKGSSEVMEINWLRNEALRIKELQR